MAVNDEDIQGTSPEVQTPRELSLNEDNLGAGLTTPEGYTLVHTFGTQDDPTQVTVEDVLERVKVENQIDGMSVSFEQSKVGHSTGTLRGRVIHDFQARGYVFRKDDLNSNTTYFRVSLAHNIA